MGLGCCKHLPLGQGDQGVLEGPCCPGGQASPAMETATSERGWNSQDLGCPRGKMCWGGLADLEEAGWIWAARWVQAGRV